MTTDKPPLSLGSDVSQRLRDELRSKREALCTELNRALEPLCTERGWSRKPRVVGLAIDKIYAQFGSLYTNDGRMIDEQLKEQLPSEPPSISDQDRGPDPE
jgi:hypothetical protein